MLIKYTFIPNDNDNTNIALLTKNVCHYLILGAICGIQKLDLSMTTILDSGFSLLLELLKNDRALKHLKLNGCFLKEDQVVQLLSVLSGKF